MLKRVLAAPLLVNWLLPGCSGWRPVELICILGIPILSRMITAAPPWCIDDSRSLLLCTQHPTGSLYPVCTSRFLHSMEYLVEIGTGKRHQRLDTAGKAGTRGHRGS